MVDVYWKIIHCRAGDPSDRSWRHGLKIACDWWNTWPTNRVSTWIFFWSFFGHASTLPVLGVYGLLIFVDLCLGWHSFQSGEKVMPRSGRRSTRRGHDSVAVDGRRLMSRWCQVFSKGDEWKQTFVSFEDMILNGTMRMRWTLWNSGMFALNYVETEAKRYPPGKQYCILCPSLVKGKSTKVPWEGVC